LWAIADEAGEEWGKLASSAAEQMAAAELAEPSWLTLLLQAFKSVFVDEGRKWITGAELIKMLTDDPMSPWNSYRSGGRVTQWQIPVLLKPLQIRTIPVTKRRIAAYRCDEFFEKQIFARFLGVRSLPRSTSDATGRARARVEGGPTRPKTKKRKTATRQKSARTRKKRR
jgi:hypothetical protein